MSEFGIQFEAHWGTRNRVGELQHAGLEHQAADFSFRCLAVERISQNGSPKSLCAMNPQLMGSSGLGDEPQTGHLPSEPVFYTKAIPLGTGFLPVLEIHNLNGSVINIKPDRKVYSPAFKKDQPVDQSFIFLMNLPLLEIKRKPVMSFLL